MWIKFPFNGNFTIHSVSQCVSINQKSAKSDERLAINRNSWKGFEQSHKQSNNWTFEHSSIRAFLKPNKSFANCKLKWRKRHNRRSSVGGQTFRAHNHIINGENNNNGSTKLGQTIKTIATKQQLEPTVADYWPFTAPNAIDSYTFVVRVSGYRQGLRFLILICVFGANVAKLGSHCCSLGLCGMFTWLLVWWLLLLRSYIRLSYVWCGYLTLGSKAPPQNFPITMADTSICEYMGPFSNLAARSVPFDWIFKEMCNKNASVLTCPWAQLYAYIHTYLLKVELRLLVYCGSAESSCGKFRGSLSLSNGPKERGR